MNDLRGASRESCTDRDDDVHSIDPARRRARARAARIDWIYHLRSIEMIAWITLLLAAWLECPPVAPTYDEYWRAREAEERARRGE